MNTIKIGGVPEHFNLPWHLTIEEHTYQQHGIQLEWTDFPGGTGAMCEALRNAEIDMAIILTEGIIKDIIAGNPSKIVQTYVASPLIWGIHVASSAPYKTVNDLQNTTAAISRYGSGSHLMAYLNAEHNGWDTTTLQFNVIKNLEGAVQSLTEGTSDYFMWEHFTTKPLVDNGTFRRIADYPTPWPCFVIAVREEVLATKAETIQTILHTINTKTQSFKAIPNINETLATRYHQQLEDINLWLSKTQWSQSLPSEDLINTIQNQLHTLDIINTIVPPKKLVQSLT